MTDNAYRQSGQSVEEYIGGPLLVALGVNLEAETGQIDKDDPRAILSLQEGYAAIADVMTHAAEIEEMSPGEAHYNRLMDELSDVVNFWVRRFLSSHGIDPDEQPSTTMRLAASVFMGAVAFLEEHGTTRNDIAGR